MPFPTTFADTELAAVNQILSAVGQAPVTELDPTNPEVSIVYDTLVTCSRECQAEGWVFNTEYHYPIVPDINKEIVVPANILRIELSNGFNTEGIIAIRRNGRLYNMNDHTYKWDKSPVECDVTWLFDWKDIPDAFRDYIVSRASTITAVKVVGDPNLYKMLQEREAVNRATIIEFECNQGNYSMFGFPRGSTYYNSYQPYKTLSR